MFGCSCCCSSSWSACAPSVALSVPRRCASADFTGRPWLGSPSPWTRGPDIVSTSRRTEKPTCPRFREKKNLARQVGGRTFLEVRKTRCPAADKHSWKGRWTSLLDHPWSARGRKTRPGGKETHSSSLPHLTWRFPGNQQRTGLLLGTLCGFQHSAFHSHWICI